MCEYFNYVSARLVTGKRWFIQYYVENPVTKKSERFRVSNNFNRIKDKNERMKVALAMVADLNENLLPFGYPYKTKNSTPAYINLMDGINLAMSIKARSDRSKTVSSYQTIVNNFKEFVISKKLEDLPLKDFTEREATMYLDHVTLHKKIAPRTFNNYKQFMTAIWNELKQRSYTMHNPFEKIKKLKITEKNRRMIDDDEAKIILDYVIHHEPMLTLCILLLLYCAIRPGEQRQLRVKDININRGMINLSGSITKNKRNEIVTIPNEIIPLIKSFGFEKWNQNDYIFGKCLKPHPTIMTGANSLYEKHKSVIKYLYEIKKLRSIEGITLYSWKDTGAMALVKSGVDPYQIMRHFRHSDLSTTQKYMKSLQDINEAIRDFKGALLPQLHVRDNHD